MRVCVYACVCMYVCVCVRACVRLGVCLCVVQKEIGEREYSIQDKTHFRINGPSQSWTIELLQKFLFVCFYMI